MVKAVIMAAIQAAGAEGISQEDCRALVEGGKSVAQSLMRMHYASEVKRRKQGKVLRYWSLDQCDADIDRAWDGVLSGLRLTRDASAKQHAKATCERYRRSLGQRPMDEYRARLRSDAQARTVARHAEKSAKQAQREETAAKKLASATKSMQRKTRSINAVAAAVQRRPMVEAAPAPVVPVAVDWSRAKVTVAPRKLGRYEVLSVPGSFSATKPGQYVFDAASCAARAASC